MHPRGRTVSVLVLAVLAVLGVAGPTPARAAAPLLGLQVLSVDGATDPASVDVQLDLARRSGVKLVRMQVPWSALEPRAAGTRDPATLAAADHAIAGASARGMRVVLYMTSSPCWASAAPASARGDCSGDDPNTFAVTRYPPRRPADYVAVATFMAKRYGSKLAAFEIWNEPDQANQFYWAGPDKPARYAALTRALYKPLKKANPKMTVLAGAFVGYSGQWLKALYEHGFRGHYDALSVHFYDLTLLGVRNNRRIQLANSDHKPMWIAESGWTSCAPQTRNRDGQRCVTQADQARFLGDLVSTVRHKPGYVRALIDYSAIDGDAGNEFGLMDASGALKPAFAAFSGAVHGAAKALRPIRVRLARSGGRVVASGSGPAGELYQLTASVGGRPRYRRSFGLGTGGTFRFALPKFLGTRVSVRLVHPWLGRSASAAI